MAWKLQSQTYDLKDVEVLDTKGKTLNASDVAKTLKEETVALASMWGQKVDPLHLRLVKDGTLIFNLPMPKGVVGFPGFGVGPVPGGPFPQPQLIPPMGPFPAPQPVPVPPVPSPKPDLPE